MHISNLEQFALAECCAINLRICLSQDGYADAVAADMRGGAKGGLPKTVTFTATPAK